MFHKLLLEIPILVSHVATVGDQVEGFPSILDVSGRGTRQEQRKVRKILVSASERLECKQMTNRRNWNGKTGKNLQQIRRRHDLLLDTR